MSLQAAFDAWQRHDRDEARRLLQALLDIDPTEEEAWVLLMYVASSESERRDAVEQTLALNPHNAYAQKFQAHLDDPSQGLPAPPQPPTTGGPDAGVRVHEEGVYEMLWDCEYCNAQMLLAKTHKFCPQCGGVQNTEARYFPPENEKVAVHDHEYVGADVICSACEAANPGNVEFCGQCGSPLTEAARARRVTDPAHDVQELTDASASKSGRGMKIAIAIVAVLLIGLVTFMFWTTEVSVSVTGHNWAREIKIENFDARREGAWCGSVPRSAYSVSRSKKVRSHKQVPDGETCEMRRVDQGDGTYKQQRECRTKYRREPIYDTWCDYRVDRWRYRRSATAKGADLNPYWPGTDLRCNNQARRGCERESGRLTQYYLNLKSPDDGATHQCVVDEKLWQQAQQGSRWKLVVGAVTGDARCDSLQPL